MSTPAREPRNVYLDQSAYGHMLDEASDWRKSSFGRVLVEAQRIGAAQVWAGPTNVIETIQATEPSRRKALAAMVLDLIEVKRLWWGYEFEAIDDFFAFLRRFAPDAIRFPQYFEHHGTVARQIWLGVLGLVAAGEDRHFGPAVEDLRHTKACNQLLHARFALAPDDWVQKMIDAAAQLKTVVEDPLADFNALSLEQITDEIHQLVTKAQKLSKHGAATLEKKRNMIAQAYGGIEVGALLQAVFRLPLEIGLLFNVPHIVARWPEIQRATGCESLPLEVATASDPNLILDISSTHTVIAHAIRAAARKGLMTTSLGVQVIVREMQRCMNRVSLPSGGLAFDADHSAALKRHNVVVTRDNWFANSMNAMAHKLKENTGNKWRPEIATTAKQLEQFLLRPTQQH